LPDDAKALLLIRTTLLTLNDALYTGNYTVLRDRGSPAFQAANTSAKLSQIFANLASQQVDLGPVAVVAPQLSQPPAFEQNRLHLKGFFPGQPTQINFEILFEPVGGQWRLFGHSVQPAASNPAAAAPPPSRRSPQRAFLKRRRERGPRVERRLASGQRQHTAIGGLLWCCSFSTFTRRMLRRMSPQVGTTLKFSQVQQFRQLLGG
jgi:hypothetical protein